MKPFRYQSLFFSIFFIVLAIKGFGQEDLQQTIDKYLQTYNNKYCSSKIYISTDKYLYTHGENIWISAFDINRNTNRLNEKENTVLLDLIAPDGTKLISKRMSLINGRGESTLRIPDLSVFGKFILQASTGSNSQMVFKKEVFIRKNAIPPFLVDLSYKEAYYGGGDNLKLVFAATDYFKSPLRGASYEISINSGNRIIHSDQGKLGKDGVGILNITLPNPLPDERMLFTLHLSQKGLEETCVLEIPTKSEDVFINFYPEGGQLVHGLKNYMNVVAYDLNGNSFAFEADILNESNEIQGKVISKEDGTAFFPLLPDYYKTLKLQITKPYVVEKVFKLPEIRPVGINFSAKNIKEDSLTVNIKKTKGESPNLVLLNVYQGRAHMLKEINVDQETQFKLAQGSLKPGINQFVVFSDQGFPLAEQMIFKAPDVKNQLVATTEQDEYRNREKVNLELVSKNPGVVSLSVCDEFRTMDNANKQNILSSVYIDSELRNHFVVDVAEFDNNALLEEKMNKKLRCLNSVNSWHDVYSANGKAVDFKEYDNTIEFLPNRTQLFHVGLEKGYIYFRNYSYENYYLASNPILFDQLKKEIKEEKSEPYYKQMLEQGQPLREVIFAIKQYQVMGNKIVFPGTVNSLNYQGGALIVLDNLKLGEDIAILDNINPYNVDEIFISTKPIDIMNHTGLNSVGVIEITTKRGEGMGPTEQENVSEEFEVVDHEKDEKQWKRENDLRTTIHWEPELLVEQKPIHISFFQSDIRSIFVGKVEGIDEKGQPIYYKFEYESMNYPETNQ